MQLRTVGVGHVAAIALLGWLLQLPASAQSDADIVTAVRTCERVAALSARLACYDRAFPPLPERAVEAGAPAAGAVSATSAGAASASAAPQPQVAPPPADPEPALGATARIVEIEMPSLSTTVFRAEDGRVFVRDDAQTVIRWPDTPFDVEVQTSLFGTSTYLKFPGRGPRVRVVTRD